MGTTIIAMYYTLKICYKGNYVWYLKPGQLLRANEVMDLDGEPTVTTLLTTF